MKIWIVESDNRNVEALYIDHYEIIEKYIIPNFKGRRIDDWEAIKVERAGRKRKCDVYRFVSGHLVVSERAVQILQPLMSDKVQILPIDYEGTKTLYVLNVINVVDCLDYEKSKIRRMRDGTVSEIDEFAFDYSKVSQHDIFKIPEKIWSTVFVSDKFKATVEENGLIGFKFTEVWDSDEKAVQERKRRYQEKLEEIRRMDGPEYTFDEAIKLLDQGKAFVSDQWKLQKNKKGDIVLGRLVESTCEYLFLVVAYFPPILITYKWKETEPSDV